VRKAALAALVSVVAGSACSQTPLSQIDEIYSETAAERVLCSANLDESAEIPLDSVFGALERAHDRAEVVHLYAHSPGKSVSLERLDAVLDHADELGLAFVTYADFATTPTPTGGLALSFDDSDVASWWSIRARLADHGAHATFFVTRFDLLDATERDRLHQLDADGHAIEAHGLRHLNGPDYVSEYGLDAYMDDEVLPSIDLLREDGFTPTVFAYPYGRRTSEIDDAVLEIMERVRSVSFAYEGLVSDPCPE
jgi:hypothetical protein